MGSICNVGDDIKAGPKSSHIPHMGRPAYLIRSNTFDASMLAMSFKQAPSPLRRLISSEGFPSSFSKGSGHKEEDIGSLENSSRKEGESDIEGGGGGGCYKNSPEQQPHGILSSPMARIDDENDTFTYHKNSPKQQPHGILSSPMERIDDENDTFTYHCDNVSGPLGLEHASDCVRMPRRKVPKCRSSSKSPSRGGNKVCPDSGIQSSHEGEYPADAHHHESQELALVTSHKYHFSEPNPVISFAEIPLDPQAPRQHVARSSKSGPLSGINLHVNPRPQEDHYSFIKILAGKSDAVLAIPHSTKPLQQQQQAKPVMEINARQHLEALKGPELDILRDTEESILPMDKKWPFLLRFPIGCFGICLGLGSQSILWKTMSTAASLRFMHVPKLINLALWCLALMALVTVFTTYTLKCIFYFEAVRREFYHPVRINFFFAPWIAGMFLALGVPPAVTRSISPVLWFCFMAPIFALELKVYGEWLSGGERRLSRVANPSTHLSLVGNFVGALLAATVGWRELAIFFWAVGLAHYMVLFVTLYQRLPTAAVLPKQLHPVFFLFVAVPSTASIAWTKIVGDFDLVARIAYFMGLFLYSSLVVRVNFFRGFRFSVTWWAYTFPMTASAIATIHYSLKVKHPITQVLAILLSLTSSITVLSLVSITVAHVFFGYSIFPNDMAIAITDGSVKAKRKIKELGESVASSSHSIASSELVRNVMCVEIGTRVVP